MSELDSTRRPIRSFVRRQGRITASQRQALTELWPRYGIELGEQALDLDTVFGRSSVRMLEIGFGNGDALLAMAAANPYIDYVGVEVHRPGVGRLLRELEARALANVRVVCADVNDVLARVPPGSLGGAFLFFPDPWPKKRHHKRRLVQPAFIELLRNKFADRGVFYLATDWEDYANDMMTVMSAAPGWENIAGKGLFSERPSQRPLTKFERRGQRLGHVVRDLAFRRVD